MLELLITGLFKAPIDLSIELCKMTVDLTHALIAMTTEGTIILMRIASDPIILFFITWSMLTYSSKTGDDID